MVKQLIFMKLTFLTSASVIVEDKGVKVLCDPWLVDGEFYGSWAHYPPLDFKPEDFNDVDFIYISHIHPDHFSTKTLTGMNKEIPVLIHKHFSKFLKNNIERLGYKVIEIDHNKRTILKNNLHINILSADNCNPELCQKYFGCSIVENNFAVTSIDSMCVMDNGQQVIVNTNDCPFPIAETVATVIKNQYKNIDMLLVGYSSASSFPQCFTMKENEKMEAKQRVIQQYWSQAESYVNLFKPRFYMPFAGRYVLSGKKSILNPQRSVAELEDAYEYFSNSSKINQNEHQCIILNSKSSFDIDTEQKSVQYTPIDLVEKQNYIEKVLEKRTYDYENDDVAVFNEIKDLISKSFDRYEQKRIEIGFISETVIIIEIFKDKLLIMTANGNGYKIIEKNELTEYEKYVKISLDNKLLMRILKGPAYAHWNNAEIGSHLVYQRKPEIYERGLYYSLSYFHS
jgi:UDP-MurNAc hydroxylase